MSYNVASALLIVFVTFITVSYSTAATSNCTALNETSCCNTTDCFFLQCTDLKNSSIHKGCHLKTNKASVITATCKNQTDSDLCLAPVTETCSSFSNNQTACCENECVFANDCVSKTDPTKNVTGCFNGTAVGDQCKSFTDQCHLPPAETCVNFTDQDSCCNQSVALGCVYVNCNGTDKKLYKGCYEKDAPKCSPVLDMCKATTTSAPATTPMPSWKDCESYNATTCCNNIIFKCILVNCTTAAVKGCFSALNMTNIKAQCKEEYVDACSATTTTIPSTTSNTTTTPVPTTPAPSHSDSSGSHFDGASFIGGIVLCAGIIVIIFFAVKFYRSRRASNNYHQM